MLKPDGLTNSFRVILKRNLSTKVTVTSTLLLGCLVARVSEAAPSVLAQTIQLSARNVYIDAGVFLLCAAGAVFVVCRSSNRN